MSAASYNTGWDPDPFPQPFTRGHFHARVSALAEIHHARTIEQARDAIAHYRGLLDQLGGLVNDAQLLIDVISGYPSPAISALIELLEAR